MDHFASIDGLAPRTLAATPWTYWRPPVPEVVELALVHGVEVALPDHFHEEDQVTFVMRGQRRFVLRRESIALGPGMGACIPAGTPHRSLPQPLGVVCVNVYLRPGEYDVDALLEGMARAWRRGASPLKALETLKRDRGGAFGDTSRPLWARGSVGSVRAAATASGMTREGYSRAFRRAHGMSPQAFGIIARLNRARQLLRDNLSPADVAAIAGFADQSHLGRSFRRAFGISPGRYRGD